MKKEEPKKTEVKVKESDKSPTKEPEIKGDRAKYVNVDESPLKVAKQHFADQFAREKERISGKPFKGEPNLEDAGDSGLLQKYYNNWLLCEA